MNTKKITVLSSTAKELENIQKSLSTWVLPASMDTVIITLLRYYYTSIGLPVDKWSRPVKCSKDELKEIIRTICKNVCGRCKHT